MPSKKRPGCPRRSARLVRAPSPAPGRRRFVSLAPAAQKSKNVNFCKRLAPGRRRFVSFRSLAPVVSFARPIAPRHSFRVPCPPGARRSSRPLAGAPSLPPGRQHVPLALHALPAARASVRSYFSLAAPAGIGRLASGSISESLSVTSIKQ